MRFFITLIFVSLAGCGPKGEVSSDPPVVPGEVQKKAPQKAPLVQEESTTSVVGMYQELNVKQKADGVPKYVGRVVIVTDEGERVLLETHEKGIRSDQEIETYRNKRVIVEAEKTEKQCQAWGNHATASIVGPCIRGVKSVSADNGQQKAHQ